MTYSKEEKKRVLKEMEHDGECIIVDVSQPSRIKFHRVLHLMLEGEELTPGEYYPICDNTDCINPDHRFTRSHPMGRAYVSRKARIAQEESTYND